MEEKQTMEEKKKPTMSGKTLKLLLAILLVVIVIAVVKATSTVSRIS